MSKFIAGGYESEDSEYDSDCDLVYPNTSYSNRLPKEAPITVSVLSSPNSEKVNSDAINATNDANRQAFLWPPNSTDTFRRSRSPTPAPIALDDIRQAVINGNLDLIQKQTEQEEGFFVDTVLKRGWTALMYAASSAQPHIVHYLLEKSADPNYHIEMYTPLMAACSSSEEDESKLLLCVQHLIKFGANINAMDKHLTTPLMFASKQGKTSIVKELIGQKADLNAQDKHGWTALHWAAHRGNGPVIRILLDSGVNLDIVNNSGQTAADVAFENNYIEVGNVIERVRSQKGDRVLTEAEANSLQNPVNNVLLQNSANSPAMASKQRFIGDLEMFLTGLELSHYIDKFKEHEITLKDLLLFTEEDLEKMGIDKIGVRRKLLDGIKKVHRASWQRSSLNNLKKLDAISCPDAVAIMANISKHLAYIETTIGFLRHQIKKHPTILEYGQEAMNIHNLLIETNSCLANSRLVFDEVKFFGKDLDKVKNNAELNKADLIESPAEDSKVGSFSYKFVAIGIVTIIGTTLIFKHHRSIPDYVKHLAHLKLNLSSYFVRI